MKQEEFGRGWSQEAGDVRGGEVVDAFEVPVRNMISLGEVEVVTHSKREWIVSLHLTIEPLHLLHDI